MGDPDPGGHRGVAEHDRCTVHMVQEPDAGAQQHRCDVDRELVQQAGVEQC
ncbi:hypothetical protein [Micropruina sonneratiae]|uniref:hypothetical protein n=1 Tax=Micropruina sonneratiae TaxID=2986940 RepID=UPI002226F00C|nr:hypothetical protein [Micropruina sp. KQZ13P-5]MCW3158606.1 hypothetical protein [Micropruina sp. KQZ13P-5]